MNSVDSLIHAMTKTSKYEKVDVFMIDNMLPQIEEKSSAMICPA